MATKRKMPVRTATLDFTADGYEDFHCETWLNVPTAIIRRYAAVDGVTGEEEGDELFLQLFPSWDFVDFNGKVIPHTSEGVEKIPRELGSLMMRHRGKALQNGAMPDPLEGASSDEPSEGEAE